MNYETTVSLDGKHTVIMERTDEDDVRRRRRRNLILAAIVIVLAAIGAWYLFSGGDSAADGGGDTVQAPAVSVIVPGRTTVNGTINATGTLAARREMPVGVVGEGVRDANATNASSKLLGEASNQTGALSCRLVR